MPWQMASASSMMVTTRPGACGVPRWSCDAGRAPVEVIEVGLVDQRAIAEQPDAVVTVELVHFLVGGDGVGGHGGGCVVDERSRAGEGGGAIINPPSLLASIHPGPGGAFRPRAGERASPWRVIVPVRSRLRRG